MPKKKRNPFLTILIVSFIVYSVYYVFYRIGYIENTTKEKVTLTSEAMERFEKDVSLGKDISLKDYLTYNQKEYKNNTTLIGNKVAGTIDYIMKEGLKRGIYIIKKLFT